LSTNAPSNAPSIGRQILLAPNLLTLSRIPLAIAFPFVAGSRVAAFALIAAAGVSDVLDGWLARRARQSSVVGQILDPVADKTFAASAVLSLAARGVLPTWSIPVLFAREIVEAPLAVATLVSRRRRAARVVLARPNRVGKIDTVILFATLSAALAVPRALSPMLVLAAIAGVAAGASYGLRELRDRTGESKAVP
jgi:phosphatidylglycerophosphate synthase